MFFAIVFEGNSRIAFAKQTNRCRSRFVWLRKRFSSARIAGATRHRVKIREPGKYATMPAKRQRTIDPKKQKPGNAGLS
jgi:hypothetical protein